jgi:branched-subunit amino acid ABC-type transport system permease component
MNIEYFLNLLMSGLTKGSIYALIALGYTMVYGIIKLINFAHGEIYMIGAFTALIFATFFTNLGLPGWAVFFPGHLRGHRQRIGIRYHHGKNGIPAAAQFAEAFGADQRHRHVHLPAELRSAHSN